MIRVTRDRVIASEKGLSLLGKASAPISIGFRINKLIQQVIKILQETEQLRQSILLKYGRKDENGELKVSDEIGYVEIPEESREAFNKEMMILLQEECELSGDPIPMFLVEDIKMTPIELSVIEPFISFE